MQTTAYPYTDKTGSSNVTVCRSGPVGATAVVIVAGLAALPNVENAIGKARRWIRRCAFRCPDDRSPSYCSSTGKLNSPKVISFAPACDSRSARPDRKSAIEFDR